MPRVPDPDVPDPDVPDPDVTVRPMRAGDVDEALDVFAAVAAEGRWVGTEAGFDRDTRRARWLDSLADPLTAQVVVADAASGRILGHGAVHVERYGVAELGMALAADARGRGLGGLLLDALVEAATALGAHKVDLQVWPHNEAAIRLYQSRGFEVEGRLRAHYRRASGQRWDAILMGLPLAPDPDRSGSGLPDAPVLPVTLDLRG
jgi:putative acetyltransferase